MEIIGQINNKKLIDIWRQDKSTPSFIIITGEKGSGKATLARYIALHGVKGHIVLAENSVDSVRDIIETAYKCVAPTTYIFCNTDRMSAQAKNALLKVTEEPPQKAYFVMTVESMDNTLATLKSRGTELKVESYTREELMSFTKNEKILEVANNPGQALELESIDFDAFYKYCRSVLDNIGTVTGVNALKIGNAFKFKEEGEGYNPVLFLNCLMTICSDMQIRERDSLRTSLFVNYALSSMACIKYKNELQITGVKKDSTFDMFVLEMRDIWKEED